ncbi:class I adenylate-forming enzyme family protein [Streptomyces sp. NBC_01304]|uniref:class I adenylate-forming enzyme family protein n=1 Tax=Streptomyces sp. NBC_01304 TaxID=2903818 RepID=UPI002E146098|nr:acyl--CoA ligase [Streptomyces sp. NBC_01304]
MSAELYDGVREIARQRSEVCAIQDVDGTPVGYGELIVLADRLAGALDARGVRAGDAVAFALPNSACYVALILAVARLRARYVPLMRDFSEEESARAVRQAEPVLLVAERPHHVPEGSLPVVGLDELCRADAGRRLAQGDAPGSMTVDAPGSGTAASASSASQESERTAVFRLLWTSGSTGFPKMMAWRQDKFVTERRRWLADTGMTAADVYYCRHPLDVAHATDLHVFAALLSGARLVLADPEAPPAAHLARLAAERVTVMSALPAHYTQLIATARAHGRVDLSALRRPLCGGAYLGPATVREADDVLGIRIRQIYGSTEFGLALGNMADEVQTRLAMTAVREVGARIEPLTEQSSETGELVLRSDCTSEGYPHVPGAQARTFRDGEFWTGDVAERLPGGAFRILGRVDEALAGPKGPVLAPAVDAEIAEACPGTEAATLPVEPGAYLNRVVLALCPGPEADPETVLKAARDVLAEHGLDATMHLVDAIPHTPVGKIDKPQLRARFALAGAR